MSPSGRSGTPAGPASSLEAAVQLARACDDRRLVARVTISLAFDVGDVRAALAMLDEVEADVDELDHPVLATQRGLLEYRRGRLEAAVDALLMARDLATKADDPSAELKALGNLGAIETLRGDFDAAREHLLRAITLAFDLDQLAWGAMALANLAYVEATEGNLPEALDAFAAAEDGYRRTGTQSELPRLYADHAAALADANLLDDAEHLIDRAVALSAASGNDLEHAELLLVSAEIDLAKGKPDEAHVSAVDAVAAFTRQGRESWLHVAERLRLRAEARLAPDEPGIAEGLVMNGRALAAGGWRSDALSSTLLAALLYTEHGRPDDARALLADVGSDASRGRGADKVVLGRVTAMLATQAGDRSAARRAVSAGLREVAAAQAGLGSLEARSQAAHHGAELIELGARLAIEDGRPRELLHRIEAMRTMVWRAPLVRAPDDEAMASLLTELRRFGAAAVDPEADAADRRAADRQRLLVEREIRTLSRRARGQRGGATTTEEAVADALGRLGDRELVAYANLTGRLWAVVARRGRTSLHDLGEVAALDEHLEVAAFALHRLNRAQGSAASRDAARLLLEEAATSLADLLLPATVARSDGPLVVVPTGALHGVPWRALAPLARSAGVGQPVAQRVVDGEPGRRRADRPPVGPPGRVRRRPAAAVRGRRDRRGQRGLRAGDGRAVGRVDRRRRRRPVRDVRPRAPRVPRLVPHRQPALLDARARRRTADRLRPRAGGVDARGRRAVGLQRRDVGGDQRRHAARAVQRARGVRRVRRDRPADAGQRRARHGRDDPCPRRAGRRRSARHRAGAAPSSWAASSTRSLRRSS